MEVLKEEKRMVKREVTRNLDQDYSLNRFGSYQGRKKTNMSMKMSMKEMDNE